MPEELHRILYIEDEPDIQAVAKLALESLGGFAVELCGSGEEAIAAAARSKPDLILLDVMMPGMDGISTLHALRGLPELREVPIVFMTAKVQAHEVARLKDLGVAGVIAKPFDPLQLPQQVAAIWAAAAAEAP